MDLKGRLNVGRLIKTKVVATLGPASDSEETLKSLIENGLDVARLNFSHGTHQAQTALFNKLMVLSEQMDHQLSVMCDIQGPKIRTGSMRAPFVTVVGQQIEVTCDECLGDHTKIQIKYPTIVQDLHAGDLIFINDGVVRLRVLSKTERSLLCVAETSGTISDHKGCNIPSGNLSVNLPTAKDIVDLELIAKLKPDLIAVSFVGCAADLHNVRKVVSDFGFPEAQLCAKIERPVALENIVEIIEASDAIMVARGDLGVEIDAWEVPAQQRKIISLCNARAVPVIVATQMLESMIQSARPTRAEVTDVYEAVMQGADAVMLSGETSIGKYPALAVKTMDRIAEEAEKNIGAKPYIHTAEQSRYRLLRCVAPGIVGMVERLTSAGQKCAIFTASHSGATARLVSSLRLQAPIYAFASEPSVVRRLNMIWGVRAIFHTGTDRAWPDGGGVSRGERNYFTAIRQAVDLELLSENDVALVVSSSLALHHHEGIQLSTYKVKAVLKLLESGK